MSLDTILTVAYFVLALVPAIVLHELSHGLAADRFGDPTPRSMGRLTLNPVKHIDPFGTVILPGLLLLPRLFGQGGLVFGYAKPMPFNPQNLRDPERQTMWIAAAGPLTNLFLALVGALLFRLVGAAGGEVARLLFIFILVNVILAVFNLLPLPPLDGSKVLARFLPARAREVYQSMDAYGVLILLAIFFIFPGAIVSFIEPIVNGLIEIFTGLG